MYDEIYAAWKREKDSEEIQPLPGDFFEKASEYISALKLSLSEQDKEPDIRSASENEIKHAEFMLLNLLKARARKIVLSPLMDSDKISPNLLEREHMMIDNLRKNLREYFEQPTISTNELGKTERQVPHGESGTTVAAQKPSESMLLRVLQPIPRLVGVDLDEYGPFQQEDLVVLPKENALALIARGAALEVRPSDHE